MVSASRVPPARGDVIVLANRTEERVQFTVGYQGSEGRRGRLAPGRQTVVPVARTANVEIASAAGRKKYEIAPNTACYLRGEGDGLWLERVEAPASLVAARRGGERGAARAPIATVPVKILVDDEQPAVQAIWEPQLRKQVEAASQVLSRHCPIRLEVVAVGTWESENGLRGYGDLAEQFRRDADPRPGVLAIGFSSQLRIDPQRLPHVDPDPFGTHILLPDEQAGLTGGDQLVWLVHQLGHVFGAAHSEEPESVMRAKFLETPNTRAEVPIDFDPLNTLVLNLVADEIRYRGPAALADLSKATRQHLAEMYRRMDQAAPPEPTRVARRPVPPAQTDPARLTALVVKPPAERKRFSAQLVDGTRIAGDEVQAWKETRSAPRLDHRELFDDHNPVRWLRDNTLKPREPSPERVEMVGGDCFRGRVVGFDDGTGDPKDRRPPHLLVAPSVAVDWPGEGHRETIRVDTHWLRRIVWEPITDRYHPATLYYRDGRQVSFRAARFAADGVRLLLGDGIRGVPFAEIAELHLPAADPWESYFQELAVLAPEGQTRLMVLETIDGLRITSSRDRFQARTRSGDNPDGWYHLVQPAWSLDPLWLAHRGIVERRYFLPHEVPLSRLRPASVEKDALLGGGWHWRADRNVMGDPLQSGGLAFAWGIGVHGATRIEFELTPLARFFRTRLGLDAAAAEGGCVRAFIVTRPDSDQPAYRSPLLIGSDEVLDGGRLGFSGRDGEMRRLVLGVDATPDGCPAGADPLDLRDIFDWLEPLVELDRDLLLEQIRSRGPALIPALGDWEIDREASGPVTLESSWDESDKDRPAYRLAIALPNQKLVLSRTMQVAEDAERLLISMSRPNSSALSHIEIEIDGQQVGRFEAPAHWGGHVPDPLAVSLEKYRGREVTVRAILVGEGGNSSVIWRNTTVQLAKHDEKTPTDGR